MVSFPLVLLLFFLLLRATGEDYAISYVISVVSLLILLLLPLWIYLEKTVLRPIGQIIEADRHLISGNEEKKFIPEKDIPNNEIGQIIRSRERVIRHLASLQEETSKKGKRIEELYNISLRLLQILAFQDERRVLKEWISALRELIQARYGAIGLTDERGRLIEFIHSGLSEDEVNLIGDLPQGRGLLGAIIKEGEVIRLDDLTKDPRQLPFLPNHPIMKTFLGVPVVGRDGKVYGGLYFIEKEENGVFTKEDESLAVTFARNLALKIENAKFIRRIQEAEERYRNTISFLPIGLAVLDKNKKILIANFLFQEVLGVKDVLGRGINEVLPIEGFEQQASSVIGGDKILELSKVRYNHPEKGERVLDIMLSSIFHGEEFIILVEDVTERVRLERERELLQGELIQAEKLAALGTMISGVAHEINNQLTPIVGFSQLLLNRSSLDSEVRDKLKKILDAGEGASRVVGSLLRFARRYKSEERGYVDINGLIEDTLELVVYKFRANGIEIVKDLSRDLPRTVVNANEVQQVFLNIINNAWDAMVGWGGERKLVIRTEVCGGMIRVVFSDTGPGIPVEYRDRVFEPFFTTKPVGKGTGLGLSVSYGIVEAHGGRIYLGDCEGGATFVVEFPVVDLIEGVGVEGEVSERRVQEVGVRGSVLVIDDEESIVELIEGILAYEGYRVDKAYDGREGLEKLGRGRYDFIICDINMPGLDGIEVYKRVKEVDPEMAKGFIFLTGDIVSSSVYSFLEGEGRAYILKPFTMERFLSVFSSVAKSMAGSVL